jgi:hypothetical protein
LLPIIGFVVEKLICLPPIFKFNSTGPSMLNVMSHKMVAEREPALILTFSPGEKEREAELARITMTARDIPMKSYSRATGPQGSE